MALDLLLGKLKGAMMKRGEQEESACRAFEREMDALKREVGNEAAARALLVYTKATLWLRQWGHGNITLSAVDHKFGLKVRGETIMTVREV